jgi:hypothetical protein
MIAWAVQRFATAWLEAMFAKCGYDMNGSPTPICPECGTSLIKRKNRAERGP